MSLRPAPTMRHVLTWDTRRPRSGRSNVNPSSSRAHRRPGTARTRKAACKTAAVRTWSVDVDRGNPGPHRLCKRLCMLSPPDGRVRTVRVLQRYHALQQRRALNELLARLSTSACVTWGQARRDLEEELDAVASVGVHTYRVCFRQSGKVG